MAFALVGPVLGLAMKAASGSTDPVTAPWTGLSGALASWLVAHTVVLAVGTVPLTVAGAKIVGKGSFMFNNPETFGDAIMAGVGITDQTARPLYARVGQAILDWWQTYAMVDPESTWTPPPPASPPGPISGMGKIKFASKAIGPKLAAAAGTPDAMSQKGWQGFGESILSAVEEGAEIPGATFTAPGGGGAVTGTGAIT